MDRLVAARISTQLLSRELERSEAGRLLAVTDDNSSGEHLAIKSDVVGSERLSGP